MSADSYLRQDRVLEAALSTGDALDAEALRGATEVDDADVVVGLEEDLRHGEADDADGVGHAAHAVAPEHGDAAEGALHVLEVLERERVGADVVRWCGEAPPDVRALATEAVGALGELGVKIVDSRE